VLVCGFVSKCQIGSRCKYAVAGVAIDALVGGALLLGLAMPRVE
jgi:hypothetical protein